MSLRGTVERVVILEDSDDDFDTVCEAVRHMAIAIELCRVTDGDACVALLAHHEAHLPSLVMLDLNAPGTDGREALRLIKRDPALQRIPVVIMTTSTNPRDVDLCYLYGANAYHKKPVRYPDHLRLIESIFRYWMSDVTSPSGPEHIV
jgi:CheY-like chemotaxis protein